MSVVRAWRTWRAAAPDPGGLAATAAVPSADSAAAPPELLAFDPAAADRAAVRADMTMFFYVLASRVGVVDFH
jgi:hypothetical protein